MADKLVTLQDENKTPIYPESRASVVKTSDGTTVEDALARKQPSGNYATKEELSNYATTESLTQGLQSKADTTAIPTKLSQLTNDSNYLTDAPSGGKMYGRKDGAWAVIESGGTQYLDLSMFPDASGTLSEEDYQKVVKAYEDGVTIGLLNDTKFAILISSDSSDTSITLNTLASSGNDIYLSATQISIKNEDKTYTGNINNIANFLVLYRNGLGTKALTDNGQYAEFAKPVKEISFNEGVGLYSIKPNTYYKYGTYTKLTITLAAEESGIINEYMFEFASGSTPTTLSVPDTVKWSGGSAPTIEASKTYQVSIVNNLALIASF